MKWFKLLYPFLVVAIACFVVSCSSATALSGLIGSKPEVTAQVGAENTKQLAGVTSKTESKNETQIDKSNIGKVDTSTRKTETIKAGTIQAQRIEVKNNDPAWILASCAVFIWSLMAFTLYILTHNKNAPK